VGLKSAGDAAAMRRPAPAGGDVFTVRSGPRRGIDPPPERAGGESLGWASAWAYVLAIYLNAVTAAIDDVDPAVVIDLHGRGTPEEFLDAG
jgi:hypothetical protein